MANTSLILDSGGGFLNLRIAGIWACHKQWSDIEELKHSTPDRVSPESLNGA
jgi:hypothetical protein